MNPHLHAWLRLSPIALSTAVAVMVAHGAVPTPWSPVTTAHANHCSPPPTCDSSCNCACNCDCAGCDFTDDGESCAP